MFARSSTIYAQGSLIEAGIAHVHDTVMPAMSHIDGFVGMSLMVNRDSGRCIATSAWRTAQAMLASGQRVAGIRTGAAAAFGGASGVEVEQWEIAVMHRAHHARPGTRIRATWTSTDPGNLDAAVDTFKFSIIAKIEDLPGFCSASLLVERDAGRSVVTVAYDDQATLDASRAAGAAVRAAGARQTAAEVLEVAEFDLEIAHLHVPETV